MPYSYKTVRRVEFSDTDLAGIMHYSNFFRFMETAEHAFFRSIGFSVVTDQTNPPVGWPRVHAECDYKQPLRFEDEVEIEMLVTEKRSKSLTYQFRFRKVSAPTVEVARGSITAVCVTKDASGKMCACTIPAALSEKIEVAPAELLHPGGG